MADGSLISTDSTHVKAGAGMERKEFVTVRVEPSGYVKKLDAIRGEEDLKVRAEAVSKGLRYRS